MVLVDIEVAFGVDGKIHHSVPAYLLKHVVEESYARGNIAFSGTIKVQLNIDVGLLRCPFYLCYALASEENLRNLVPRHSVTSEYKRLASNVPSQLGITFPVAYDIASFKVVFLIADVFFF